MSRASTEANLGRDRAAASGLALLVTGTAWLFTRVWYDSYDANIMGQVAGGLVHRGSVTVLFDGYHLNSPSSFFGLGMSLLMLPGVVVANLLGATDAEGAMVTNAWLLGGLAALLYAWCRLLALRSRPAAVVALVVVTAMGLLPFAGTGFSEVALAIAIAAGMVGLTGLRQGRWWGAFVVGAAAGLAVLVRDDSAVLVVPWLVAGALVASPGDGRREVVRGIVEGGAPFALVWAAYNWVRFGAPWSIGHSGVLVFDHGLLRGLYGLTVGPGRGLLLFAPALLVAALGARRAWAADRVLAVVAAGLLGSRVIFYAPYWGWYGGGAYGPRYVLPGVVVATIGLVEVARQWSTLSVVVRAGAAVVVAVGCLFGVAGAAIDHDGDSLMVAIRNDPAAQPDLSSGKAFLDFLESDTTGAAVDRHMADWSLAPVADHVADLVHGDVTSSALSPPDAPRLVTAAALVALGLLFGSGRLGPRARTAPPDDQPSAVTTA